MAFAREQNREQAEKYDIGLSVLEFAIDEMGLVDAWCEFRDQVDEDDFALYGVECKEVY